MVNSVVHKTDSSAMSGWLNGLLGVIIFSGSLPATRVAVLDMNPFFLTFLRASIAGFFAMMLIVGFREKRPQLSHILPLVVVALGVVIGFPLLTALALQHVTSAHSIVFSACCRSAPRFLAYCAAVNAPKKPSGCSLFWAAYW